ncbi:hypothetical protein [Pseudomonas mosselii]|nr:hypothetical protein [Pseudomonas mosselii]
MEDLTPMELAFIELLRKLSLQQQKDIIRILEALSNSIQKS